MHVSKSLALAAIVSFAACLSPAQSSARDDDQVLRQIKTELWPRLYREQDVGGLDRLLHPGFQMIDGSGQRSTKAQELDYVSNNKPTYLNFRFEIVRLDIYPNGTAVVDGIGHLQPDQCGLYTYASSNILIKENGHWRAIASHVSGGKASRLETEDCQPSAK